MSENLRAREIQPTKIQRDAEIYCLLKKSVRSQSIVKISNCPNIHSKCFLNKLVNRVNSTVWRITNWASLDTKLIEFCMKLF